MPRGRPKLPIDEKKVAYHFYLHPVVHQQLSELCDGKSASRLVEELVIAHIKKSQSVTF